MTPLRRDEISVSVLFQLSQRKMTASTESVEVDRDFIRLEKFRLINKRGHASESSIQAMMYYDTADDAADVCK